MKKLSANVCAVTHAGRVRKENEDNYSLNGRLTSNGSLKKGSAYVQKMTEPFHISVCDGMGGETNGELASAIAVETIAGRANEVYNAGDDFAFSVANTLNDANARICKKITEVGTRMGTTLATVYAVKGKAICVSIGDTRIYHFSNGILQQASFDHTHAQGMIDAREISSEEIGSVPDAKHLTKHLGVFPEEATLQPGISVIDNVENGDIILLCSDGLTDMLSDAEISDIISRGETPQDISAKLIRKSLEKGGKDNVTVVTALMSVEDTSVFAPIAEAMVGDKDPDYEAEYRNSYGVGVAPAANTVSPYANADASVADKSFDKLKVLKIAVVAVAALAVIALAAVIIKAVVAVNENEDDTTKASETSVEDYYSSYDQYYSSEIETTPVWSVVSSTDESSTDMFGDLTSSEENSDDTSTESTTSYSTTTRRYTTTTRKATTTTKRYTTTRKSTTKSTTKATTKATTKSTTKATTKASTTESTTKESTTKESTTKESTTQESTTQESTVVEVTTSDSKEDMSVLED